MENSFRSCKYGLIKTYYQLNDTKNIDEIISTIDIN